MHVSDHNYLLRQVAMARYTANTYILNVMSYMPTYIAHSIFRG